VRGEGRKEERREEPTPVHRPLKPRRAKVEE
jgi:hypothetical protein